MGITLTNEYEITNYKYHNTIMLLMDISKHLKISLETKIDKCINI